MSRAGALRGEPSRLRRKLGRKHARPAAVDRPCEGAQVLTVWAGRRRQRRQLFRVAADPALLRDLGLSRDEALHEARRPFWAA